MSGAPCRLTQVFCVVLVVLGIAPWIWLTGGLLVEAVHSRLPVTVSVAAWLAMLVPVWVAWFAVVAWRKRHETSLPAVVMAAPQLVVTTAFLLMPSIGMAP